MDPEDHDDEPLVQAVVFLCYLLMFVAVAGVIVWWLMQFVAGIAGGA